MALLTWALWAGLAAGTQASPAVDCSYDRDAMLALAPDDFDQDMEGGWRTLAERGCALEAADLLAAYRTQPKAAEASLLAWHEAQMRADFGQTAQAIALMQQSYKPAEKDKAGWNLYVDGSIAFLQHDRPALEKARAALAAVPVPPEAADDVKDGHLEFVVNGITHKVAWPPNLNVLDGLLQCFDKDYHHAYGEAACRPPAPAVQRVDGA